MPACEPLVAAVLHLPHFMLLFESARHRLLLKALRLPDWVFATGYKYIQQGEPPPGLTSEQLLHVGEARQWQARSTR